MAKFLRSARAFYRLNPTLGDCPSCHSAGTIVRSHSRTLVEKTISKFTFYKYYKCKKCGWRGSIKTLVITSQSFLVMFLYLILIFGAAFITHQILKRLL